MKENLSQSFMAILIGFILFKLIVRFVAVGALVCGTSMEPTLKDGQKVMSSIISYYLAEPERFDVVIIDHPREKYIVKRIIGLPGERVRIDEDGKVYINDVCLVEEFISEPIFDSGIASEEICLGVDEYFVLGDNRNGSTDSRSEIIGNISRAWIIAKVILLKEL